MAFVDYTKEIKEKEMTKRILFLGAGYDQIPAIQYAKKQGYYVITCDYLPDNPGHKFSDEYHNVNTTDKEAVLELAQKLNIDGILGFGTDANAPTQAYVGNELVLPSNPYESIITLTRKDLFRSFLKENDFFVPLSRSYLIYSDAVNDIDSFTFPLMIKPVDSSGSNGITKIETVDALKESFEYAQSFSREKKVIIEEFFDFDGSIIDGDGFFLDGDLVFNCWGDTQRSELVNPLVPIGTKFPATISAERREYVNNEVQRMLTLLKMRNGPFNIEFGFDKDNRFLIFDFGPRNGGSAIPKIIQYATGVDMVKYTVESALGSPCSDLAMVNTKGFFSEYRFPALEDGIFSHISYSKQIRQNIIEELISVVPGDPVKKMKRAADRIGVIYLKFNSHAEMEEKMNNMEKYLEVIVEKDRV